MNGIKISAALAIVAIVASLGACASTHHASTAAPTTHAAVTTPTTATTATGSPWRTLTPNDAVRLVTVGIDGDLPTSFDECEISTGALLAIRCADGYALNSSPITPHVPGLPMADTCVSTHGAQACSADMAQLVAAIESGAPVYSYGTDTTVNAGIVVGPFCGYEFRGTIGPFCGTD